MINIKELRIGNYVLVDSTVRRVTLINNDGGFEGSPSIGYQLDDTFGYESCSSDKLAGVPLSSELLQDLGFTYHPHFKLWQHVKPNKSYSIELDADYTAMDFAHRPIVRNMRYLHQLQNLFHAVQGEDLNHKAAVAATA